MGKSQHPSAAGFVIILLCAAAGGCGAITRFLEGEPQSRRDYRAADELFQDERYEQAAVAFNAWLADYHDSEDLLRPLVMFKLGECYRLRRDYRKATEVYSTLIEKFEKSPQPEIRELVEKVVKPTLDDVRARGEPKP